MERDAVTVSLAGCAGISPPGVRHCFCASTLPPCAGRPRRITKLTSLPRRDGAGPVRAGLAGRELRVGNASGHIAILAGAGLAAFGVSASLDQSRRSETAGDAPVVVTLPKHSPEPTPSIGQQRAPSAPAPADRGSLARQLQTELKRVGCYDGEVNGAWTTSTRMAMKAFTDRVNAKLPIDKPDHILLTLVQGHRQTVCGATCPAGQALQGDGRCVPDAILAKAAKSPGAAEVEAAGKPNSASAAAPAIAAVPPALVSPPTEVRRAPPKSEQAPDVASARAAPAPAPPQALPPPALVAPPVERPQRIMPHHGGPVPAVGIYDRRARRHARRSRQIRYVRSLLRSLQRAAGVPLPLP